MALLLLLHLDAASQKFFATFLTPMRKILGNNEGGPRNRPSLYLMRPTHETIGRKVLVERGEFGVWGLLFDVSTYARAQAIVHVVVEAKIPKFFNFNKQLRYYLHSIRRNPPSPPLQTLAVQWRS